METKASFISLIVLTLAAVAGCRSEADGGVKTENEKPQRTTVYVGPVKAKTANDIASRTAGLIAALRRAGFDAVAVSDDDKTEKAKPYVTVHAMSDEEYCLEGLVKMTPVAGSPTQAEMRLFRSQGGMKLSQEDCSDSFAAQIAAALNKSPK